MHIVELPSSLISSLRKMVARFCMIGIFRIFSQSTTLLYETLLMAIEMHLYVTHLKRKNIRCISLLTECMCYWGNVHFIRTKHRHCFEVNKPEMNDRSHLTGLDLKCKTNIKIIMGNQTFLSFRIIKRFHCWNFVWIFYILYVCILYFICAKWASSCSEVKLNSSWHLFGHIFFFMWMLCQQMAN